MRGIGGAGRGVEEIEEIEGVVGGTGGGGEGEEEGGEGEVVSGDEVSRTEDLRMKMMTEMLEWKEKDGKQSHHTYTHSHTSSLEHPHSLYLLACAGVKRVG